MTKIGVINKSRTSLPNELKGANKLNSYFTQDCKNNNPPEENLLNFYNNNNFTVKDFNVSLVTGDIIARILNNIKTKAFGADQLNITLILLALPVILTHI